MAKIRSVADEKVRAMQGERLRAIRQHYGVSQQQFADDLEIDRTTLWKYERGERSVSAQTLFNLWEKYQIPPGAVIGTDNLYLA